MDVGNLISGSSGFSKSSLNIWKFTVHIWLKPGLENFQQYFTSMWDECNCGHSLALPFFGIGMKTDISSPVATVEFSKFADIECSTLTASSFSIWNSSTGIPSPPLALFAVMLPKAYLTLRFRMSHSLAYEITQPIKTNHVIFCSHTWPLQWPTLCMWSVLLSESE